MKKILKVMCGALFGILILWTMTTNSKAASTSLSVNKSSVEVGDTITVTAKVNAAQWNLSLKANETQLNSSMELDNYKSNITKSFSGTYKAKSAGTVTFSLTGDITDVNQQNSSVNKTKTVTVRAVSSNSGSGSSSNGGSSSSGSSGNSSSSSGSNSTKKSSTSTQKNDEETKPSFRDVNETVYATESGINVRSSYSTSSSSIGTLSAGDELTRTGKATNAVNGITWSRVTYNGQTAYVSSSYLSTEKPEESADKTLKSLEIDGNYTLTPEFNSDVTEYTLNVPEDVTSLDFDAVPTDENAKVEITGNDELLDGVNTVEITVTAEDGTARTYTINVTKGNFSNIGLSELSVDGYTLTPEFSSDVFEYTLEINDLSITSLNVNAVADQENATVEVVGNTDLKPGENIITILVKSEDGEETSTYQIVVNIVEKQEEQLIPGINNNDLFLYGGIALGVLIILIIVIAVIRHKNKVKKEQEGENYYGGFDSLNKDTKNKENKSDDKDKLTDTQELNTVINNKNVPDTTEESSKDNSEETNPIKKHRKSVIEENFGADIKNDDDNDNDKGGRKRGKHF